MRKLLVILATVAVVGGAALVVAQTPPPKRPSGAAALPAVPPPPPNPYAGFWLDHTGDGIVEIQPCSVDTPNRLCGRIVWLREPNDPKGKPLVDGYNEDASQRNRPICGLPILGNLVATNDGKYDDGWIYDPRQGKAFSVELTLMGGERMQVMGYKGVKLLNRKFVWTRVPDLTPAQRCQPPRV